MKTRPFFHKKRRMSDSAHPPWPARRVRDKWKEGEVDWLQQHVVDHLLQLSAEARVAVRRFDDKRNGTTAPGALERQNSSSPANYVEFAVYAPAVWPGKSCFLNLWVYLLDQHAAISERAADGGRLSKLEGDASGEELPPIIEV